jgi:hypothetical protein
MLQCSRDILGKTGCLELWVSVLFSSATVSFFVALFVARLLVRDKQFFALQLVGHFKRLHRRLCETHRDNILTVSDERMVLEKWLIVKSKA